MHTEPLGLDYRAAVERAEMIRLPAFDGRRTGDSKTATAPAVASIGTLDWVLHSHHSATGGFTETAMPN
jgi:hypothetical protein